MKKFFTHLQEILYRVDESCRSLDFVHLDILQRRLGRYFETVLVLFSSIEETSNLKDLADRIVDLLTTNLVNIGLLLDLQRDGAIRQKNHPDVLASTGGRPAYNITGHGWRGVAKVLGISVSTLYRKHIELNVADTFSQIENEELDDQIGDALRLTPYYGEIYVRGALQGRGIMVQELELGKL